MLPSFGADQPNHTRIGQQPLLLLKPRVRASSTRVYSNHLKAATTVRPNADVSCASAILQRLLDRLQGGFTWLRQYEVVIA